MVMDLFDKLALEARRFDPVTSPSGSRTFTLHELLETFGRNAILEMTTITASGQRTTVRPDSVRKLKVSLLDDGISAIHSSNEDRYEVSRTAPSGDLSKVRIVATAPDGSRIGELRMLMGRRTFEHYFEEDPILAAIRERQGTTPE